MPRWHVSMFVRRIHCVLLSFCTINYVSFEILSLTVYLFFVLEPTCKSTHPRRDRPRRIGGAWKKGKDRGCQSVLDGADDTISQRQDGAGRRRGHPKGGRRSAEGAGGSLQHVPAVCCRGRTLLLLVRVLADLSFQAVAVPPRQGRQNAAHS